MLFKDIKPYTRVIVGDVTLDVYGFHRGVFRIGVMAPRDMEIHTVELSDQVRMEQEENWHKRRRKNVL